MGSRRGAIAGHPLSVSKVAWLEAWNDIVYALPLVDSWPFWRGETKYPTPAVERMYVVGVRRVAMRTHRAIPWQVVISAWSNCCCLVSCTVIGAGLGGTLG